MKLECSDLKSAVEAKVNQLGQAMQNVSLEHPGPSSAVERLDGTGRLSPANDFLKSLGVLISRLDPIAKVIDDVSLVSR